LLRGGGEAELRKVSMWSHPCKQTNTYLHIQIRCPPKFNKCFRETVHYLRTTIMKLKNHEIMNHTIR